METKQTLGLIGSILLFIGVFMPIVSVPFIGTLNYFQNGKGDGVIVLVLAVISLVLTLTKKYAGLWATGLLSISVMLFTFVSFQLRMNEVKSNMERQMGNNPFKGLANAAIDSVQIQWGWAILVLGAILLIAAAALKDKKHLQNSHQNLYQPPY